MKISELSRRTEVPIPTIKFYLREGLLPPGKRTGRNQADYDEGHLERLTLIRAFRQDAGLSIEQIGSCLRAADRARKDFVTAAMDALDASRVPFDPEAAEFGRAKRIVLSLARGRGWRVKPSDQCVQHAAGALAIGLRVVSQAEDAAMARGVGTAGAPVDPVAALDFYAAAAESIAACEIPDNWRPGISRDAALRYAVLGTVLFEPFILALRRMAHVSRSRTLEQG